jgi:hypothetical protein
MKKIIIFLFAFYFIDVKAQNNFQWADSGAVWHHTYNWISMPGYQKTTYVGDTIINNQPCQIIKSNSQQAWPQQNGTLITGSVWPLNVFYLYKSNDSVFAFRNNIFNLVFKTNATPGEIWDLGDFGFITNSHAYVKVDSVYYQNYNGVTLRNIHVFPCKQNGDSVEFGFGLPDTNYISKLNTINEKFGPLGSFQTINNATPNNIIDESLDQGILCYQSASFPFIQFNSSDCFNNLFVGVDEQIKDNFQLFPNPAHHQITIKSKTGETIIILDVMGKIVLEKQLKQDEETIEIDHLYEGFYILKIGINSEKIIKY